MKQQTNHKRAGEKNTHHLLVRLSPTQHKRLKALAESSGYKNVSDYVRIQLLNPSLEIKLNNILELLQKSK